MTSTAAPHVVVIDSIGLGDRSYVVHDGVSALVVDPQRMESLSLTLLRLISTTTMSLAATSWPRSMVPPMSCPEMSNWRISMSPMLLLSTMATPSPSAHLKSAPFTHQVTRHITFLTLLRRRVTQVRSSPAARCSLAASGVLTWWHQI